MAQVELVMPKMGESIMEATILKWLKKEGDEVEMDETILEIATDKVDSEIPSPVDGVISKILFEEDETVEIGKAIAIIATEGDEAEPQASPAMESGSGGNGAKAEEEEKEKVSGKPAERTREMSGAVSSGFEEARPSNTNRFYSPLVRNIAKEEGVTIEELDALEGSGMQGRVTKRDILAYLEDREEPKKRPVEKKAAAEPESIPSKKQGRPETEDSSPSGNVEIVEMDRMRKMISEHMVMSKQTSPHVTSFVEADVTNLVEWRSSNKQAFHDKYGEKITFTPIFIEAVVKALKDFPMVNVSVEDSRILVKKDINVGMATALPNGNLIVPVIKKADGLNLAGLAREVNALADKARKNRLKPDDIQGGTFTLTNVGTFGNVMGTPIIFQPQVAIMATGAIRKKPAVVETEYGDMIAIRHMMYLSLSYDHRVVDGFLGGSFLRKVADYLEEFEKEREY